MDTTLYLCIIELKFLIKILNQSNTLTWRSGGVNRVTWFSMELMGHIGPFCDSEDMGCHLIVLYKIEGHYGVIRLSYFVHHLPPTHDMIREKDFRLSVLVLEYRLKRFHLVVCGYYRGKAPKYSYSKIQSCHTIVQV